MLAMLIRPSLKFVKLSYVFGLLLAAALGAYILNVPTHPDWAVWGFVLPGIWLLFTLWRHMQKMLVKMTILGDRLRFERGFFSKSTETIDIDKVQEVRVHQTLWQRMFKIGDLMLETAGKSSGNGMESIDNPQDVADHIQSMGRAQRVKPDAVTDPGPGPSANAGAV
jgi:uncharacterized membrane protein YdbT with pleckstrin-like domain